jgi:hypothetical protein
MDVEFNTEVSRSLLTLVHIMYLLLFLFLLARRSQQVLCLGFERGLKPLPNELRVIIIKINLTTNYQILLNCNKVHRAHQPSNKGHKRVIFHNDKPPCSTAAYHSNLNTSQQELLRLNETYAHADM